MGRQLKINEWLQVFDLYESYKNNKISKRAFKYEYLKICGQKRSFNKDLIDRIKIKIKKYNLGMNIESKTGRSPKKKELAVQEKNFHCKKLKTEKEH